MRHHLPLFLILALAAILRLTALGQVPAGITADEVSQGYSAYSLLKTGKDEWGINSPLTSFRAFADYRAPLQTYLILPSVALFGLTEFAVRLPSAIFGILAVLAVYLLTGELFGRKKITILGVELGIAEVAALFMALSPWSIQFSRTALEANFASFLFPLGFFLFLRGLRGNRTLLVLSAPVLALDLYSYLAAKLFVPLFLLSYLVFNRRQIAQAGFRRLLPFIVVLALIAAPIYLDTLFGPGNVRGKDLVITNFSLENIREISIEQYFSPLAKYSTQLVRVFSNKLVFTVHQFIQNYVSYLSPTFWFTEGGREITYSVFPGYGLLPLWMFPLVIFAIFRLFVNKEKNLPLLLFWLFLAIIPAAITKEGYRPNRAGSLLGFWEIVAAYGFWQLLTGVKLFQKKSVQVGLLSVCVISLVSYLNLYFFTSVAKYPTSLSYGYRDLMKKVSEVSDNYQQIIFDKGSQSQIFVAFYTRMDPATYQKYSETWWPIIEFGNVLFLDMLDPYSLDKYIFKSFNRSDLAKGNLVVIRGENMNPDFEPFVVDSIKYPDQSTAFYLLTKK